MRSRHRFCLSVIRRSLRVSAAALCLIPVLWPFESTPATPPDDDPPPFTCAVYPHQLAVEQDPDARLQAGSSGPPPIVDALGEKRLLIYRIDFSDAIGAAISSNAAATLIQELDDYYRNMSYGRMSFAHAQEGSLITDTLRLPEPSANYNESFQKLIDDARTVAAASGYDPGDFDTDIVCTGSKPTLVFGAVAFMGGPGVWLANSNFTLGVAGHELGHNFGLPHASYWDTGQASSIGPGALVEYGDPYDSMGVPGGSSSHFNARFKALLGWLTPEEAPRIFSAGLYRLHAQDHIQSSGIRALRFARDEHQDYWIEYRQFFSNRWITNGASLRWAGLGAENTLLIDTTPGSAAVKQDVPVELGRTFSDPCAQLHLTVIAKSDTSPGYLDVMIQQGPFPSNASPTVTLSTSGNEIGTGVPVTLTALAVDSDGDAFAYWWDFGDGNSGLNQSSIDHAWSNAGDYIVHCIVTDMKGGIGVGSVSVKVGSPAILNIEGQVLSHGQPLPGVLIRAFTRSVWTDDNGAYRLPGLPVSTVAVTAQKDGFQIISILDTPASPGVSRMVHFTAVPNDWNAFALVPFNAMWRFLDTGATPGDGWTELDFDDGAWNSGPAILGYGGNNEATMVDYGPDPLNRYITTYFRHRFTVVDPEILDELVLELLRDDGAVVYLNGQEIRRDNLPAGEITPTTLALADVTGANETARFVSLVPKALLVSGPNILAAEVHQFRTNSNDLSFGLECVGLTSDPAMLLPSLQADLMNGQFQIQWPVGFLRWRPQSAELLGPNDPWQAVSNEILQSQSSYQLLLQTSRPSSFYRLLQHRWCSP